MKAGTLLKIKPEWRNPGESEDTVYKCVEDRGDRIVIELRDCNLPIPPQEVVPIESVEELAESVEAQDKETTFAEWYKQLSTIN